MDAFGHLIDPSTWGAALASGWSGMGEPGFGLALGKIAWINILLSGDNAVVIAMACRGLPARQRAWGMVLGAGVAIVLRILFTGIIATLTTLPFMKIAGGLALFYIAAKLLVPEDRHEEDSEAVEHLWRAVRVVAVADIVMSLDNVIAIAIAAAENGALLVLGLALSIPLIVIGAGLIMALLDRYPILVWGGAALLGWIVGEVIATDTIVRTRLVNAYGMGSADLVELVAGVLGAVLVVAVGGAWRKAKSQGGYV